MAEIAAPPMGEILAATIRTNRKVLVVDGKQYVVVKLAASAGHNDKVLVINEQGENEIITVPHMTFIKCPQKPVTISY